MTFTSVPINFTISLHIAVVNEVLVIVLFAWHSWSYFRSNLAIFNSIQFNYHFTEHELHALMVSQYLILVTIQTGYVMAEPNRSNMGKQNEKYMGYQD